MDVTLKVILVEDDDGHATLVLRTLARATFEGEPVHLHDGQDLLDYLYCRDRWAHRSQHHAVAIILDLNMPRLGGIEARRLKNDRALARIPMFVLTTTDNPHEIDRCYALGAAACLVKPIEAPSATWCSAWRRPRSRPDARRRALSFSPSWRIEHPG